MQITINGITQELDVDNVTVSEMLRHMNVDAAQVAVEKNMEIVPRSQFDTVTVATGDSIELVEFVGGG